MHSIVSASVCPLVIRPFHSSAHTENTLSLNPKSHLVTIFTSKSLDFDSHINVSKPGLSFHETCELKSQHYVSFKKKKSIMVKEEKIIGINIPILKGNEGKTYNVI